LTDSRTAARFHQPNVLIIDLRSLERVPELVELVLKGSQTFADPSSPALYVAVGTPSITQGDEKGFDRLEPLLCLLEQLAIFHLMRHA
jgi:hypothetical protein